MLNMSVNGCYAIIKIGATHQNLLAVNPIQKHIRGKNIYFFMVMTVKEMSICKNKNTVHGSH